MRSLPEKEAKEVAILWKSSCDKTQLHITVKNTDVCILFVKGFQMLWSMWDQNIIKFHFIEVF
jgi:hypothetical protein